MIKLIPILPKRRNQFDARRQQQAIDAGLGDAKDGALEDFRSTTSTWSHQPTFTAKTQANGVLIGTKDDIWLMLEGGTRPHTIVASKIALRFPGAYAAKTRPGFIGSQSGGASGGPVFRRVVHHPGTVARGWSKLIAKKWRFQVARLVQKRINEAMR